LTISVYKTSAEEKIMFLGKVYFGNAVQDWLIAAGILIIVFTALKVVQRIAIRKLEKLLKPHPIRLTI
jgi:hypothetical protein